MKCVCMKFRLLFTSIAALLLLVSAGCGSGTDQIQRYQIDGTVTFKGQPVPYGTITLMPDSEQGNSGPGSIGIIEDGNFEIPAQQGIIGGSYLATIQGQASRPESHGESVKEGKPLFKEFHISVTLPTQATTQAFEVPDSK